MKSIVDVKAQKYLNNRKTKYQNVQDEYIIIIIYRRCFVKDFVFRSRVFLPQSYRENMANYPEL